MSSASFYTAKEGVPPKSRAQFTDYLALARFDHVTKHIFIIPGIMLAYLLRGVQSSDPVWSVIAGLIAVTCIASANYVINEYLDRDFDRHHPTKSARPSVQRDIRAPLVWLEWAVFVTAGLAAAMSASMTMFFVGLLFACQGIVYNVRPFRSKDVPFVDVLSESVNNPLRLMIGWAMIDPQTLPPSSVILAYWLGGAFLMGAKRLSEYREIVATHSSAVLIRYRRSFAGYDEISLTISCFLYALLSSAFLGVFLIKYRIEYIILLPAVSVLFAKYLALSMLPGSTAQKPERLFRERGLMAVVLVLATLFVTLTFIDLPFLERLTSQQFISLG